MKGCLLDKYSDGQQGCAELVGGADLSARAKSPRLASLDALRGFDMLWIIGVGPLVRSAAQCFDWPILDSLAEQMLHVEWEGFRFYDLIFPMFLFIVGVAIPFSLASLQRPGVGRGGIYFRAGRRMFLLVLINIIYNGALSFRGVAETRFAGVLALIGIGYFFAFMIVMHFAIKKQVIFCLAILLGYWTALMLIPVPGYGAGILTPEGSLASYVDRMLLPGRLYGKVYDPEGIMQCFSGISMALIGALTGQWLMRTDRGNWKKLLGIFIAGLVLVGLGVLWGQFYPIIKMIWTGSFILLAAGCSMLLLSFFYLIMDCAGLRKWAIVYTVVGVNPITIYLAGRFIGFSHANEFFFSGMIKFATEAWQPMLTILGTLLLKWIFLYLLYRKRIFLKL